jgi:tRNA-Thr(GGU) m(6)t(6)A37 methyltransferase TsaA
MEAAREFILRPIGTVKRVGNNTTLEIDAKYRPALKQLDKFSHVMVFWWADKLDNEEYRNRLQTEPPYAKGHMSGVFATRAEYRPNPIAMTTCQLLSVDEEKGIVRVANIDALDDTPVIDLKAYFPVCDRVQQAFIPDWLAGWPEWMPEEGIGLYD